MCGASARLSSLSGTSRLAHGSTGGRRSTSTVAFASPGMSRAAVLVVMWDYGETSAGSSAWITRKMLSGEGRRIAVLHKRACITPPDPASSRGGDVRGLRQ